MDMKDLKKEVESKANYRKERSKRLYKMARELGFNAYEAAILCHRSEKVIRNLAKTRGAKKDG